MSNTPNAFAPSPAVFPKILMKGVAKKNPAIEQRMGKINETKPSNACAFFDDWRVTRDPVLMGRFFGFLTRNVECFFSQSPPQVAQASFSKGITWALLPSVVITKALSVISHFPGIPKFLHSFFTFGGTIVVSQFQISVP